jgi:hypothetical protein
MSKILLRTGAMAVKQSHRQPEFTGNQIRAGGRGPRVD